MQDLFCETKSKKEQLRDFILSRNFTKTSDVLQWGLNNYHTRALRDAQELCAAGEFRRMTESELGFYFPGSKQEAWVKNGFVA